MKPNEAIKAQILRNSLRAHRALLEKALVLKDALNAHKTILESLDYQLNEVLIDISNHNLPIKDEKNSVKNNYYQSYRSPNREPL